MSLAGVRIVELGGRSVSLAGRLLADLGAEVVLVEPPGGAALRQDAPYLDDEPGTERGFGHLYLNANKRSVVLDLDDADDRDRFAALLATADALLEATPVGWLAERDLSPERLRELRPGLIQCSVTPFGLTTPWRARRANDLIAGAAGGLIQVSGEPRGTPVQGGAQPSYCMASLAATSAICIALHQREHTPDPPGIHIDLSLQEATVLSVMQTANPSIWQWHKRIPTRPGLSTAMACKDGKYVGHLVRPDRFDAFLAWADALGIDHGMTSEDWRWARLDAPRKDNPVAETTLAIAAAVTRDEFVAGALEADIVCLPVLDFPDLEREPQFSENQQFFSVRHDQLDRELGFVRSPIDAFDDPVHVRRAPLLGEDQALLDQLPDVPSAAAAVGAGDRPEARPERALAGLRVVDFGWVLAAPIGTRILASFGAEVIRVESSTKPDSMRSQIGPDGKPDPDLGGLYNVINAGKKSLAVDLSTPAGLELVKDLIATADVVVNNFRPGALDRMGLGYDALRALKPDIVLLNLPGAHRQGPWARRPSMGNILMAASGFNMLTGFPGERPRGVGIPYPDFTSPHLLVAAILSALRERRASGRGQQIHLTQLTGVLGLLGAEWMRYKATGEQPPRNANRDPNFAPHGVYPAQAPHPDDPARDAWIAIAVRGEAQWRALCTALDAPEMSTDERFATHAVRKRNEDALDAWLGAATARRDKWRLADELQAAGLMAAAVEDLRDMLEIDPQLPDHYQQVRQPVAPNTDIPIDREAARWLGTQHDLERAPGLGEHSQWVVQELLGRSDEEFGQLLLDNVIT
ncbi:MAG: CoA transferase [Pseudomonadota bacterium]